MNRTHITMSDRTKERAKKLKEWQDTRSVSEAIQRAIDRDYKRLKKIMEE